MKIKLFGVLFFCTLTIVQGQNAYYETLKKKAEKYNIEKATTEKQIRDSLVEVKKNIANYMEANISILNRAKKSESITLASKDMQSYEKVSKDEYLSQQISKFNELTSKLSDIQKEYENLLNKEAQIKAESSFTGLMINNMKNTTFSSNAIKAITIVITERFKQDITMIYFDKMKNYVSKIIAADQLFPNTRTLFSEKDPFDYFSLGREWRVNLDKDLKKLPINMKDYLKNVRYGNNRICENRLFLYLEMGIMIADYLIDGDHPFKILEKLDKHYEKVLSDNNGGNAGQVINDKISNEVTDFYNMIHALNIIQKNIQKGDKIGPNLLVSKTWASYGEIVDNILSDATSLNDFLEEIIKEDPIFFQQTRLKEKILNIALDIRQLESKITPVFRVLGQIMQYDEKHADMPSTFEECAEYMQITFDLIWETFKLSNIKVNDEEFETIQKILDIYKDILRKQYMGVIRKTLGLITLNIENISKCEEIQIVNSLIKYSTILEGMATAKNSEEMKELFSMIVLPPGSFSWKRMTPFSLCLEARPGIFYGKESINRKTDNGLMKAYNIGLMVPVGIELAVSKGGMSLGALLSLIDLGAPISYRFSKDDTSGLPSEITWKQIFSPGVSIQLGLKNSPISIGIGWQFTPELRKISDSGLELNKNKSHRCYLAINWDLPLIKIWPIFSQSN